MDKEEIYRQELRKQFEKERLRRIAFLFKILRSLKLLTLFILEMVGGIVILLAFIFPEGLRYLCN